MALDFSKEINFEEAIKNAHKMFKPSGELEYNIQEIFDNPKINDKSLTNNDFWLMACCCSEFL